MFFGHSLQIGKVITSEDKAAFKFRSMETALKLL
jgi:hypothetical protein